MVALLLEGPAGASVGGVTDAQTPPADMNDPLSLGEPYSLNSYSRYGGGAPGA